jgi:hypothetical protein
VVHTTVAKRENIRRWVQQFRSPGSERLLKTGILMPRTAGEVEVVRRVKLRQFDCRQARILGLSEAVHF